MPSTNAGKQPSKSFLKHSFSLGSLRLHVSNHSAINDTSLVYLSITIIYQTTTYVFPVVVWLYSQLHRLQQGHGDQSPATHTTKDQSTRSFPSFRRTSYSKYANAMQYATDQLFIRDWNCTLQSAKT